MEENWQIWDKTFSNRANAPNEEKTLGQIFNVKLNLEIQTLYL